MSHPEEHAVMEKELAKRDVLCVDCKYYQYISFRGSHECMNNKNLAKDMVSGGLKPRWDAWFLRDKEDMCGIKAKWFEPKDDQNK